MGRQFTYRFPFASFPALRVVALLITGICLAHLLESIVSLWLYGSLFTILISIWGDIEFRRNTHLQLWKTSLSILLYSLMLVCFGAGLMAFEQLNKDRLLEKTSPLQLYEWETITVKGQILSRGKSSGGRNVYEIRVSETRFTESLEWHQPYKIRVYGSDESSELPVNHHQIEAELRVFAFPEKRNPHEFDYGKWLLSQSIVAHGELQKIVQTNAGSGVGWYGVRQSVLQNIDELFSEKESMLAKALFIGYKKELTEETRSSFARAGLSHIMAVSGMHVGFIVAPFWLIIPWLWRWKWGKALGVILLTLLLIGYAGLTGFSASVSRASIMAWLLTYGKLYHKLRHSVNLLAVAAIILLLIRPSQLFDVGFQLSFSAVLIILLIMPEAQRIIPLRYRFDWRGGLMTIIIISVIVQVGLFPILAFYFGEFSVIGPVANALVVPLLAVVVPVGLVLSLIGGGGGELVTLLSTPISWALAWIGNVADNLGGAGFSYISIDEISLWLFPAWTFAVASIATIRIPRLRWKILIVFLVSLNILLIDQTIRKGADQQLVVTVLDVGQGDAIHIKTPSGKNFLVDAGRWSPGGNSGERIIHPYLQHHNIKKLDAVLLSHPHADHIGGMPDLIEQVPIDTIYQSDFPYDSRLYERYINSADSLGVPIRNVASGDMVAIDPLIRMFIVGPQSGGSTSHNANNHSMAFRLDYGATSFLFTGDAELSQEREMANQYGEFLNTDFLKTGHHGSKTSSTPAFLNLVKPEITVTSLAFRNRFGHPHRESMTHLANTGAKNYFTSLSGALIFTSDGENIVRVK